MHKCINALAKRNDSPMLEALKDNIKNIGEKGLCIAFSGGTDSALLLKLAVLSGVKTHAVTFVSVLNPKKDLEQAQKLAQGLRVPHTVLELNPLENKYVRGNSRDRCYHCKKALFSALLKFAEENGYAAVADGTNADDLTEYRPGLKALEELGIHSPLAKNGVSKNQVRILAAQLGLEIAKKPSSPCLATRIPYGTELTPALLAKIDEAERFLRNLGLRVVRVRSDGATARIETEPRYFDKALIYSREITRKFKELGFDYISLDLEGYRSGSYDAAKS